MKLKLESVRDISVLVVEGAITPESFAVLKAGIKKLFRDGKNKIILELPDSGGFTPTVLREIAVLNLTAAELSGSIALAQIAPLTRAKIEAFSKPPIVNCFSSRAEAVESFYPKTPEPSNGPMAAPAPASAASPADAKITDTNSADEAAMHYKEQLKQRESGELGELRKRLVELENENVELKARLTEIVIVRREPPDVEAWREKVTILEKQVSEAIKAAQEAAPVRR
jgi:hypothetical protein